MTDSEKKWGMKTSEPFVIQQRDVTLYKELARVLDITLSQILLLYLTSFASVS